MAKYNFLQRFLFWLASRKPEREVVHSITEEALLVGNEQLKNELKNVKKELQTKNAQLAKKKSEELEIKEKRKGKDLNNEIAIDLKSQKKEIDSERYGRWMSMRKFFYKFEHDKKFREKFEAADMNDEKSWKFGDFKISTKGYWAITDSKGNLIKISYGVGGLIYKPESIFNQIKRGRLLLARDKNGDFVEEFDEGEIENEEIKIPVWNDTEKRYGFTSVSKKNARELVIELMDKIREFKDKCERLELISADLKNENYELKNVISLFKFNSEKGKSMLTEAKDFLFAMNMNMTDLEKRVSTQSEQLVFNERLLGVKDTIIAKLLSDLEKTGGMTARRKAEAEIKGDLEFLKTMVITPAVKEESKTKK